MSSIYVRFSVGILLTGLIKLGLEEQMGELFVKITNEISDRGRRASPLVEATTSVFIASELASVQRFSAARALLLTSQMKFEKQRERVGFGFEDKVFFNSYSWIYHFYTALSYSYLEEPKTSSENLQLGKLVLSQWIQLNSDFDSEPILAMLKTAIMNRNSGVALHGLGLLLRIHDYMWIDRIDLYDKLLEMNSSAKEVLLDFMSTRFNQNYTDEQSFWMMFAEAIPILNAANSIDYAIQMVHEHIIQG